MTIAIHFTFLQCIIVAYRTGEFYFLKKVIQILKTLMILVKNCALLLTNFFLSHIKINNLVIFVSFYIYRSLKETPENLFFAVFVMVLIVIVVSVLVLIVVVVAIIVVVVKVVSGRSWLCLSD